MVRRVSAPELVTLGEAFEDLVFLGLDCLPRPGEEVKTSAFVRTVGGGAVITAVAASRLGLACGVWSGLGDDAAARLAAEDVGVANFRRAGEPHAITAALSTRADRSFVTFNGINDQLEGRLLDALPRLETRHAHFALYPHDCARWERAVGELRLRGVTTSWDFGWNEGLVRDRGFIPLLRALDFVFVNEREARLYAQRHTLPAALDAWRSFERAIIVKLGARGSRWLSQRTDLHVPAPRVKPVDTTGAGDAFNGGFLAAWLRGLAPSACLRLGNFVGASSTRAAGGLDGLPAGREVPAPLRRAIGRTGSPAGRGAAASPRRTRRSLPSRGHA